MMPSHPLFANILNTGRQHNASDIHLIAGLPPAFRVSGEIIIASCNPISGEDLVEMTAAMLNEVQAQRLEEERELCVSYHHEEAGRIRLSIYHRLGVPEMAIRLCNTEIRSAAELMLPDAVEKLARLTSGLILIAGPTGMGKTTTFNYIIDVINATRRAKVITIEDPVEFEHAHRRSIITQIEVGTDTLGFASCLRHVLRLNPDVIGIGEMRDLDTIDTALTAAETGHLVIATLHTPSAAGSIERIIGVFDGQRQSQITLQLASTLQGVIAQRLIPTVDKTHRVLASEVLLANDAVRSMIRENRIHMLRNTIATSRATGMVAMEDSLFELYTKGIITIDQAMTHANDLDLLRAKLKR